MNNIETQIQNKFNNKLHWKRYIDDIFVAWSDDFNAEEILSTANSISKSIKFTLEKPSTQGILPFLDCEVSLQDHNFHSKIYFKNIHSGVIHSWNSHSPISTKSAIVNGELRRAINRSTTPDNEDHSIQKVLTRFRKNGYPSQFLNRCLQNFRKQTHTTTPKQERKNYLYIKCPYIDERQNVNAKQ